jgi:hypothetical protein
MVFDYVVILRNKGKKLIDIVNMLLCLIALLYVIYNAVVYEIYPKFQFAGFLVLAALLALIYFRAQKNKTPFFSYGILLYIIGTLFLFNKNMGIFEGLFGLTLIILATLEKKAKANLEIGFSTQFIMFDDLFKKKYAWGDFNNIVLKDNILTLDFKNNRLFQKETIDDDSDCDEDEFNEFCREQLAIGN